MKMTNFYKILCGIMAFGLIIYSIMLNNFLTTMYWICVTLYWVLNFMEGRK